MNFCDFFWRCRQKQQPNGQLQRQPQPKQISGLGVGYELLNQIKRQTKTTNKKEIIAVANDEINQWKPLKNLDVDGSAYVMWQADKWNEILAIENDDGLQTATAMATADYVGEQSHRDDDDNPFKRSDNHHINAYTAFDLFTASNLMLNKRFVTLSIDCAKTLGNAVLYRIAETVLIRRFGILDTRLKNRTLGSHFLKVISNVDTSKWDAVAFKLMDDAIRLKV